MRYVITFVVCALIAVGSVVIWIAETTPQGEGAFGVAKMLPFILVLFSAIVFSLAWFPANLGVLIWHQLKDKTVKHPPYAKLAVIFSAIPFCFSAYFVTSTWIPAWHRDRIERHYETLAMSSTINPDDFDSFIEAYCAESQGGLWPERGGKKVIQALIYNRASPPEVLGRLADGLDDRSYFLFDIAAHPNCPPKLINRFLSVPLIVPYLARNPKASPELLNSLSLSTNSEVRICVARNLNTPRNALEQLAKDSETMVRDFAGRNLAGSLNEFGWR